MSQLYLVHFKYAMHDSAMSSDEFSKMYHDSAKLSDEFPMPVQSLQSTDSS
jgi:hypothetical protein